MKLLLVVILFMNSLLFAETQEERVKAEEARTKRIREEIKRNEDAKPRIEVSDFKWLQEKITNNARLVVESSEIIKILLKRDLKTEFNNLWENMKIPEELQRMKEIMAEKSLFYDDGRILRPKYRPNSYEYWSLEKVGTSREFFDQGSGLFYMENRKKYSELVLEKFKKVCSEYQKIILENKVEQRLFLIEDMELYKSANLISKNPEIVKDNQNKPEQEPKKIITKKIVLKNGNEIPILMSVETTSTLIIKTIDGKMQEIQKTDISEIK